MARNQFKSNVKDTLKKMISDPDIMRSIGVAKFSKKQKGVFCKFYIRNGKIYSVFSSEFFPDYITRFYQSGDLNEKNLQTVKANFKDDLRNPRIPEFITNYHMVTEETMENVSQDFFLDIFDNIIEWDEVNADWITGETTDSISISSVSFDRAMEIIDTRRAFLQEVAEIFSIPVESLAQLKFIQKKDNGFNDNTPIILHQLLSMADGQRTLNDTSLNFGITSFRAIQTLYNLWYYDNVTVLYEGVEIAPFVSVDQEHIEDDSVTLEKEKIESIIEESVPRAVVTAGYKNLSQERIEKSKNEKSIINFNTKTVESEIVLSVSDSDFDKKPKEFIEFNVIDNEQGKIEESLDISEPIVEVEISNQEKLVAIKKQGNELINVVKNDLKLPEKNLNPINIILSTMRPTIVKKDEQMSDTNSQTEDNEIAEIVENLYSKLMKKKEHIQKAEESITVDQNEINILQTSLASKRETLKKLKEEYNQSIKKLRELNNGEFYLDTIDGKKPLDIAVMTLSDRNI